jgi:FtsZ-interacting cell division protein ZipA
VGELRAILLGIAVCLLALIWWWTTRNSRQARGGAQTEARQTEAPLTEAPLAEADSEAFTAQHPPGDISNRDWGVPPLEPLSIKTADFDRVPILEMPMMVDVKTASGLDDETLEVAHKPPPVLTQVAEPAPRSAAKASSVKAVSPPPSPQRPATPQARTDDSDRFAPPEPRSPNASEQQRIVTIRVCAVGDGRWSGGQLMTALESQGLAYGKYKVYHRRHVDGRSLFCVASLIEPGTFDIELMPQQEFRGLTLFAVLPGPAEPLQTIDALLTTARGLAENLTAMVQDAQGLPLSPLRAAALREDIARFQAQLA